MIKKNVKVSEIVIPMILELGAGDVLCSAVHNKTDKYVGLTFANNASQPVGTKRNCVGVSSDDTKPEIMMTFTDIKSIEVLEKNLAKSKIRLRNFLEE